MYEYVLSFHESSSVKKYKHQNKEAEISELNGAILNLLLETWLAKI